jgi:hypothetical protein
MEKVLEDHAPAIERDAGVPLKAKVAWKCNSVACWGSGELAMSLSSSNDYHMVHKKSYSKLQERNPVNEKIRGSMLSGLKVKVMQGGREKENDLTFFAHLSDLQTSAFEFLLIPPYSDKTDIISSTFHLLGNSRLLKIV